MFQVPEPWNGDLERASLLYVSSNPSISDIEEYPTWDSSEELIQDFFTNRFGGGIKDWVIDGKRSLAKDGLRMRPTAYWAEIVNRSRELFGREATPGVDYAITEIVHCKSRNNIGVDRALHECGSRYLKHVLKLSNARVVAFIGKKVGSVIRSSFKVPHGLNIYGPGNFIGKERVLLFLAAPGSNKSRALNRVFTADERALLRRYLNS